MSATSKLYTLFKKDNNCSIIELKDRLSKNLFLVVKNSCSWQLIDKLFLQTITNFLG